MLIGQTICCEKRDGLDPTNNKTTVHTPWIARQGDGATTAFEIVALSHDTDITVSLMHKNSEDTGNGAAITSLTPAPVINNLPSVFSFHGEGIKELVRYKIELEYTGALQDATGYCHFRILNPSWEWSGEQGV